jgi:isoquinoline 1-oxidoreductase subunit alpha
VHVNGEPTRACITPASAVVGKRVVTIEGLARPGLHKVQKAWIEHEVPQCGYCQTGMIMSAVALLAKNPRPNDEQIDSAMTNMCRCGTYARVRRAIHAAAGDKVEAYPAPAEAPNGQKI